ncbi:hypothetical protein, conserved [Babesia ovata]|uniref:Extracellular matrix-binding ebh n=1 Tax=Babesia ovata TaxID=189622 RepID=A0A2H6KJL0_9APIC|nr:uncharacterized protein BOVATA_046780 [Babesia ovata]GBE63185.1 hypothetical protein, conserved [Babesia ovata]
MLTIAFQSPQNASQIDKLNKDLQSHKASLGSLETLNELCGYAEKIQKNLVDQNPSTSLLNNLCTGLENFLGYEKGNYTGSGIVYSDLDRLCDGVMSFLHGVLQTVKNDSNLNKYANTLEKSVNELKTAQGKSGLKGVLGRVTSGIGNYVHEFEKDSEAFKSALNTLDSNHIKTYSKALESLNSAVTDQNDELVKQLNQCNQAAGQFTAQLSVVEDNFKRLDENLKNRLKDDYNTIKLEVTRFAALAGNGVLLEVLEDVDKKAEELGKLKGQHEKEHQKLVTEKVAQLKREIQQEIDRIIKDVSSIESDLQKWIAQAESFVKEAERKANLILPEVDDTQGKEAITKNARALQDKAEKLLTALQETHGKVTKLPQEITQRVKSLEGVYEMKIKEVAKEVHSKVTKAVGNLASLKSAVQSGLEVLKEKRMDRPIHDVINALQGGIKDGIQGRGLTTLSTAALNDGAGIVAKFAGGLAVTEGSNVRKLVAWAEQAMVNGSFTGALDLLSHTSKECGTIPTVADHSFKNFKALLEKLYGDGPKVDGDKNFFDCLIEDLRNNVKKVIQAVKENKDSEFQKVFADFNRQTTQNGGTLKDDIQRIAAFEGGIIPLGTNDYKITADDFKGYKEHGSKGALPELEAKIKEVGNVLQPFKTKNVVDNFAKVEPEKQEVKQTLERITNKLAQLKEWLNKDGKKESKDKGILPLLKELQGDIGKGKKSGLEGIQERIKKLHKDVLVQLRSSADQKLQAAETKAHETKAHEVIGVVHDLYQEQIKLAVTAIRTAARDQYNATVHKALQALTQLYEKHKKLIEDAIKTDEASGIKGLMKEIDKHKANLSQIPDKTELALMALYFNKFLAKIMDYGKGQVDGDSALKSDVKSISLLSHTLFDDLYASKHFDHTFKENIKNLTNKLSSFSPKQFVNSHHPELADILKKGMTGLANELQEAYVSAYSQQKFNGALLQKKASVTPQPAAGAGLASHASSAAASQITAPARGLQGSPVSASAPGSQSPSDTEMELTTEGRNCAKVCLTIMEGLFADFNTLKSKCNGGGEWNGMRIHLGMVDKPNAKSPAKGQQKEKIKNPLGEFFDKRGFKAPEDDKKQNGELRYNEKFTGQQIKTELLDHTRSVPSIQCLADWMKEKNKVAFNVAQSNTNISFIDFVEFLRWLFRKYYNVCQHIHIDSPKAPSNIYQMMQWLSGLRFNPMRSKLEAFFKTLLDKPNGKNDHREYKDIEAKHLKLDATTPFTADTLVVQLGQVCLRSQLALVAILGHGHAGGIYACDFRTNQEKLSYPSNVSSCLDMLVDILRRVFQQTYFVYSLCKNGSSRGTSVAPHGNATSCTVLSKTATKSTTKHVTKRPTKWPTNTSTVA